MISPDIFIPLAEECNLIGALSKLVVEKCCQDAKQWLSTGEIQTISVNISARQMLHETMVQAIVGVLGRNNIPFNQVIFEITESTLMEDSESGQKIMERLHALGIQLALDDFGSGYSNLKQLSAAPISVLKIDRSLLQGVESNQKASSIYENAIALGKKLHMLTVSEGVETQAELDFVTQCGCDLVQGYFFGKPCQAGEMQDLLTRCNRSAART